jgi:hypothetical protein
MVKNKKAWLRIIEATVGIVLILSAILVLYQKNSSTSETDMHETLYISLDEIAKNYTLRQLIIDDDTNAKKFTEDFLKNKVNPAFNYTVLFCKISESPACNLNYREYTDGEVFSAERIISTKISESNFNSETTSKKIRIYAWRIE